MAGDFLWAQLIYTNQQAFACSQKPLKIILRIFPLPEQQCYAMFTRPFSPTHTQKKKAVWLRETKVNRLFKFIEAIKILWCGSHYSTPINKPFSPIRSGDY